MNVSKSRNRGPPGAREFSNLGPQKKKKKEKRKRKHGPKTRALKLQLHFLQKFRWLHPVRTARVALSNAENARMALCSPHLDLTSLNIGVSNNY
jgi:hypothetical protein